MEGTRVTLLGSFIDFVRSFGGHSEENRINSFRANSQKILKESGIKELLQTPKTMEAFEKLFKNGDKLPKGFVTKVKTSSGANGGNGKGIPTVGNAEREQTTIEGNEIGD